MNLFCVRRGGANRRAALLASVISVALVIPVLPAAAEGWPHIWHAYGRFDGTAFNDPIDQPAGNAIADLSSGVTTSEPGPLPSVYAAADGTNLNIRFRLKTTPGNGIGWNASKGGLTSFAYVVQLGVAGTHVASIGLDGTHSSADYVYVAPTVDRTVNGVTYTPTNPKVVSTWNGSTIPMAQLSSANNPSAPAETFLDFSVPLADISLVAPSVTLSTPLQFMYGTSAAANLVTINKDYMSNAGTTCAAVGCGEVVIGSSQLDLVWADATPVPVSGPHPPAVGQESRYDLTLTARNRTLDSLSTLAAVTVTDELPDHVSVLSASTASGSAEVDGRAVTWAPDDLGAQQGAELTVRVAVTPDGSWRGQQLPLTSGPAGTGTDSVSATVSTDTLPPLRVSPVAGTATSADIAVSKSGPASAAAGSQVIYTLGAANSGPASAPVTLTDMLPEGVSYVSATGTGWACAAAGQAVTCAHAASLPAGTSAPPVTVSAAVAADAPATLVNTVTSSGDSEDANESNNAATAVTTVPQPDPEPVVVADEAATLGGEPVRIDVLANDSAPGSALDPTSVQVTAGPATGTVSVDPATGAVTYTPDPGVAGTDTFTYQVCNTHAQCATGHVTVTIATPEPEPDPDPAPVVVDDAAEGLAGESIVVAVLANDSAPGSSLDFDSLGVVGGPVNGATSVDAVTGTVTYTPADGFVGDDGFTYRVCNAFGVCATGQVTIIVSAPPEPDPGPVAVVDAASGPSGQPIIVDVLANDSAPGSTLDPTSVRVIAASAHGRTAVDTASGAVTYIPHDGFVGDDGFAYEVCNALAVCASATVSLTVFSAADPDPAPVAVDDDAGGPTGEPVTVDVLANDSAPGSALEPSSVTVTHSPANATIESVDPATGAVTYRPDDGFEGLDEFGYSVCNAHGVCATAVVSTATPPVDLEVRVARTGPQVRVGQPTSYTVTVTNLGPRFADAPLSLTLMTSGLGDVGVTSGAWTAVTHAASAERRVRAVAVSPTVLHHAAGLAAGESSAAVLTGTVTGDAGSAVVVEASVSGPFIELVYANNESAASDTITAEQQVPTDPTDPADPTDPTDPTEPGPIETGTPGSRPSTGASSAFTAVGTDPAVGSGHPGSRDRSGLPGRPVEAGTRLATTGAGLWRLVAAGLTLAAGGAGLLRLANRQETDRSLNLRTATRL